MFKISDFSRFTCVSIKMLRHYDDIGLLKPAHVDSETGYRYYAADQLPRLNRIIALKYLGFSLEQIAKLLDEQLTSEHIAGMLKLRRAEIEEQLRDESLRLKQIEARLQQIEQEDHRPLYDVIVRVVEPQLIATIRAVVPSLGTPITRLFDELEAYVAEQKARSVAAPLMIFHDAEYRETDLDVEVGVPITHALPDHEHIQTREITGGLMACVVYTGDYDKTPEVLNALLLWLAVHDYCIAGQVREVYLRFGADNADSLRLPTAFLAEDPKSFVTELQLPVEN
jgi:DNA-binding transcriptional MerR regulator